MHLETMFFLMGIYYMEKTYPRRFAREFHDFSQNIRLHVEEEKSWFELEIDTEPDSDLGCLWYKDQQKWIRAELHKGKPVIPSDVFEFNSETGPCHRGKCPDRVCE